MGAAMAKVRSLIAFLLLILDFAFWGVVQRLLLWPAMQLSGDGRGLLAAYMKSVSATIFWLVRLGGGHTRRLGTVPTGSPVLIVMNHQSLLDIPTVILMERPRIAWFVTRKRYGRFVPVISPCIRLMRAPLIEPGQRTAALKALRAAAREQEHGLLIFPEGHRTPDGSIQPFHGAGLQMILRERPVPVYLVVTDGFWTCGRFTDVVFNMHRIDGRTEVLGPFAPAPDGDLAAFVEELRGRMIEHLASMRERRGHDAAA